MRGAPEDRPIALALELFPNLTSIDIRYSGDFEVHLFYLLGRILMTKIEQHTDLKRRGILFAKLTSVTISAPSEYGIELIDFFATLPSVKIINAENFVNNSESPQAVLPEKGSNASDLNISNADISPRRLMIHLQRYEQLQSFTYWPTNDPRPRNHFDALMIITALVASAQNSLRELHIRSGSATPEYMGSLRKFRVLEYVETDIDLLFRPNIRRPGNFFPSLPSSIEEVKLHGWQSTDSDFEALIIHLIRAKNESPGLRSIDFFETNLTRSHAARLQDLCAENNICLKFVDGENVSLPIYTRHRGHYAERQAKKALAQREKL